MKLSDIKGKRSLSIIADAMELADLIADDERFKAMVEDVRGIPDEDRNPIWRVFCKHVPKIIRDEEYADRIVSIMAAASNVTVEEYEQEGELIKDLFELLVTDSEALGFLTGSVATTD
jgi:hypothetical protein